MGDSQARSERAGRARFRLFRAITTRWMDNDVYGHVNNVIYYSLFDTAVNGALVERGLLDPMTSAQVFLVVETGCRYFEPVSFPQQVEAGIAVARLGMSSVTYSIGLFADGGALAAAQGHFVHVNVDRQTRRPVPIRNEMRAFLESLAS